MKRIFYLPLIDTTFLGTINLLRLTPGRVLPGTRTTRLRLRANFSLLFVTLAVNLVQFTKTTAQTDLSETWKGRQRWEEKALSFLALLKVGAGWQRHQRRNYGIYFEKTLARAFVVANSPKQTRKKAFIVNSIIWITQFTIINCFLLLSQTNNTLPLIWIFDISKKT
jgi:hypothetical protein